MYFSSGEEAFFYIQNAVNKLIPRNRRVSLRTKTDPNEVFYIGVNCEVGCGLSREVWYEFNRYLAEISEDRSEEDVAVGIASLLLEDCGCLKK